MLAACRLEPGAESIEPSSTCAQLHAACILTIAYLMPGVGAQAGGSNSRISSLGPSHAQTKPPASRTGQDLCFSDFMSAEPSGSEDISTMLPSTSNFQPWYRQRSPHSSLRPKTSEAPRCGQCSGSTPSLPLESRNTTRSSPTSRDLTGAPSASATSSERQTGSQ